MDVVRRLLRQQWAGKLLLKILKRRLKWFCRIYGHDFKVSVNKPKPDPVLHHTLYCGRCNTIFGYHDFPYVGYAVQSVNPQYGHAVTEWLTDCGLHGKPMEKLVENLQKFRMRAIKPDVVTRHKGKKHDDHIAGKEKSYGALLGTIRPAHGK